MRLRRRVIYVLRIALSSAMMISSRMSMANLSATFMTNSESPTLAFATLRFGGNALEPNEISRVLKEEPTRAYRKGQRYRPGPRSPEITRQDWSLVFQHEAQDRGQRSCRPPRCSGERDFTFCGRGQAPPRASRDHEAGSSPGPCDMLLAWPARCSEAFYSFQRD